jgi:PAS domain S-box-containing protein
MEQTFTQYNQKYNVDELLLSSAVYYSQDSIIITTTELDGPGPQFIYVNPGFTRMTGYLPEEVLGKHPESCKVQRRNLKYCKDFGIVLTMMKSFTGVRLIIAKMGVNFIMNGILSRFITMTAN